ncbi:AroM family protein [Aureibacillus halotolerans]|uniref:Protein AroM n=1 Tax=Aureibacillus halotolerans TaxID=1508390 RepID=A0A4R6TX05_9BACI|nr:AroM family protein [Aureibacillus halotolerans]TDQ36539.1 protein AroM [Aureibacillus halotolerans]
MTNTTIGLLTIGQAPRTDLTPELLSYLGNVEIIEKGALDGFTQEQLLAVAPSQEDITYVSRLETGHEVNIGKSKVQPLLDQKLQEFKQEGIQLVMLACTGQFASFSTNINVLYPDRLLTAFVQSIAPVKTLGIVLPSKEQVTTAKQRWQPYAEHVTCSVASPYEQADFQGAANEVQEAHCDVVILDCMGYTKEQAEIVQRSLRCPVVLSRKLFAVMANAFLK